MKKDFMMKRLANMLNDEYYDLPERYAPALLDEKYITFVRQGHLTPMGGFSISFYEVTELGEKAYLDWVKEKSESYEKRISP